MADTMFNLYGDNVTVGNWYLVPVILDTNLGFKQYYPIVQQNIGAGLRHSYVELNSTTLNRTVSISASNKTITGGHVYVYTYWKKGTASFTYAIPMKSDLLKKSEFFTSKAVDFVDFFDNTLLPDLTFTSPFWGVKYNSSILARTSTEMVAMWSDNTSGYLQNGTYIADLDGHVKSFTYTNSWKSSWPYINGLTITFSRVDPSSIPGFDLGWLLVSLLCGTAIVLAKRGVHFKRSSNS